MQLDVRPVFTSMLDDAPRSIAAGADARVDALVGDASRALETARRLGVRELGTSARPLYVHVTADPAVAGTPMFQDADTLLVGSGPIDDRARDFLGRAPGATLPPGASWLDVDLGNAVPHEVGHGVVNELVPQLLVPAPRVGAWRTHGYDQRVVEEMAADVFAAIHDRTWTMSLGGLAVRDAGRGVDHVGGGRATVDLLNEAREVARGGVDHVDVGGVHDLAGSRPHALAGLLTPAFATVERGHGWDATEAVFTQVLARLRARDYPIDVPSAARETARAAAAQLGTRDEAALAIRRMLMGNGSMG